MTNLSDRPQICVRLLCPNSGQRINELLQSENSITPQRFDTFNDLPVPSETGDDTVFVLEHCQAFDISQALNHIVQRSSQAALIVLGDNLPIDAVRSLARFELWDTRSLAIDEVEIVNAILAISRMQLQKQDDRSGAGASRLARCWSFVSTVGGAGASLIAAETAYQLSRKCRSERVCLFDLNFVDGSLATYLNAEPHLTRRALQAASETVDTTFLRSLTFQTHPGLDVIAAPRWTSLETQPDQDMILRLLDSACEAYDTVLIDLPRWPTDWSDQVFAGSDLILMMSELTVPALNASRYWIERMEDLAQFDASVIRPVLNRHHKGMFGARVSVSQAEETLRRPVFSLIRSDWPSALAAVNLGKAVSEVKPNSPITRDVSAMIDRLLLPIEQSYVQGL